MTDDQSFDAPDPFDDELRRRFAGSAPAGSDPDVVLDAMRPQLARARTRRRASFASAIAGVAVIVIALAFVLGGGGGSSSVHTPPATQGPIRTVPPTPTTAGVGGSATTPDTLPDDHGNDEPTGVTTPSVPDAADEAPQTSTPTELTPPTQAVPADTPYSSDGGSIIVRFENGQVSLVSNSPAAGFSAEVHDNGPTARRGAVQQRADRVADPGRRRERSSRPRDHEALTKPRGTVRRVPPDPSPRRSPHGTHEPVHHAHAAVSSPPAASGPRRRRRCGDGPRALRGVQRRHRRRRQ